MKGLVSRLTDIENASEGGSCCFGFLGSVSAEDRADCEFFDQNSPLHSCPSFRS